ncbi:MAG: hypothetical protein ABTQ34_09090 [Bdellovibrionales bacterium]
MPSKPQGPFVRQLAMLLLLPFLLTTTSCSDMFEWDEYEPETVAALPARYVLTSQTPPMPLAEYVPWPSRTPTQIWRPGYWIFNGVSFEWIPGSMIVRPSPTAVWSSDRWVKHKFGWGFEAGYWQ